MTAAALICVLPAMPKASDAEPATFGDAVAGDIGMLRQALGSSVGAYLDRRLGRDLASGDQALHDGAAAQALWSNTKGYGADWHNPDTGARGTIEPSSRVERNGAALCRHFHDSVRLPGQALFGVDGIACLNGREWTVDY